LSLRDLSRRDDRTQPGVSTPGTGQIWSPPRRGRQTDFHGARSRSPLSSAPSGRIVFEKQYPGLTPRAESLNPFGIKSDRLLWQNVARAQARLYPVSSRREAVDLPRSGNSFREWRTSSGPDREEYESGHCANGDRGCTGQGWTGCRLIRRVC
jgi:hypothetical protein